MNKTALITGITGQDGAYLAELLVQRQYKVYGLVRSLSGANIRKLAYLGISDQVTLMECDLQDLSQVISLVTTIQPGEIYNLAAQSSVSLSFQQPIGTLQFNINSVLNLLEAIRIVKPGTRFYQASSSEMYGRVTELPVTEDTRFHPLSPYAISKLTAHHITINYRESYNLYSCCGILFNHESYLRAENFFVKKVIMGALDIMHGKKDVLELGNLDIKRDFGYSKKYVEAMWLMLQQDAPDDFIICSGKSVYLRQIVEYVFDKMNIERSKIVINKNYFRPTEIEDMYGSSEKAFTKLQWKYDQDFFETLDVLMAEEALNYGK
jgi:GDPmannose 4,6-dehydratase